MAQETGAHYNVTVARPDGGPNDAQDQGIFFGNQNVLRGWASLPGKDGWILEVCALDKARAFDLITDMLSPDFVVKAMTERTMQDAKAASRALASAPVPA